MGFYLRKSVRMGPFRLNLSKSGIGVSAGIPGLRFGSGPRGSYINAGRGGIYYRKSFGKPGVPPRQARTPDAPTPNPRAGLGPAEAIESGNVLAMTDSTASELLAELNTKHRRPRYWRLALPAWFVGFVVISGSSAPSWLTTLLFFVGIIGIPIVAILDHRAKRTALLYELDASLESAFRNLCDGFDAMRKCVKTWHIQTRSAVDDRKHNAGASEAVERAAIRLRYKAPPYVKTNVSIPALPAGKEVLYFFPDRILVYAPNGIGAVSYHDLKIDQTTKKFVETTTVPRDAKVVDRTWKYVNMKGGPDHRYKDNPELPILLYEVVELSSDNGLKERFSVSQIGATKTLIDAATALAKFGGHA